MGVAPPIDRIGAALRNRTAGVYAGSVRDGVADCALLGRGSELRSVL
jgi:hypothetical protein